MPGNQPGSFDDKEFQKEQTKKQEKKGKRRGKAKEKEVDVAKLGTLQPDATPGESRRAIDTEVQR